MTAHSNHVIRWVVVDAIVTLILWQIAQYSKYLQINSSAKIVVPLYREKNYRRRAKANRMPFQCHYRIRDGKGTPREENNVTDAWGCDGEV